MARQQKTERQRAEEAVAVSTRKVQRLKKESVRRTAELAAINSDLAEAERILAYRRQHPALPATPQPDNSKETPAP